MKKKLIDLLTQALSSLAQESGKDPSNIKIEIKENADNKFGDYSTNLAMIASKIFSEDPKKLAKDLIEKLPKDNLIKKIDIAGPGFINFYLEQISRTEILKTINSQKNLFGFNQIKEKNKKRILIEYVSSNPTGPLHVGHGRGAVYGSVLSSILKASGYEVDEEYYINDQGRQMDTLAASVWLRYIQNFDKSIRFPNKCYKGEYVKLLAEDLKNKKNTALIPSEVDKEELSKILSNEIKEEKELDFLIKTLKEKLRDNFEEVKVFSLKSILKSIKKDLKSFGVEHNLWFKESSMFNSSRGKISKIEEAVLALEKNKFIYEKEGALWFRSTDFKDEKDRVIKRENGETTYFASDIAYHSDKFKRGYNKIINIWGADHHGYLPRVKAAMSAMGEDITKFEVIFIQFANLVRGKKKVSMSTREGEFTSLGELIDEVSPEAARFFYINRRGNQHLNFDLDLAKEESKDNPLFYVQYAHARICSIFKKVNDENRSYDKEVALKSLNCLERKQEVEILQALKQFPEVINKAKDNYEPHLICYYLRDLAHSFHSYYSHEKILVEDTKELQAKLFMLSAVKQVIFNGLNLLGISSPESM